MSDLYNRDDFAPQLVRGSPGAETYAVAATEASLDYIRDGVRPLRAAYGADPAQRLDIFAPPGAAELPVLLFFHGGAWTAGYLWWLWFMARGVLAGPAIFVAGTYRLAPAHRFPAQLADVAAAFAWLRRNIAAHGGDPNRLFVGGHSAGGHLAALLTLRRDLGEGDPPAAHIRGCFPVSSSFDLQYKNPAPGSGEERVYKYLFSRPEDDRLASPIEFLDGCRTPFHVTWGERDFDRIVRTGERFVAAMQRAGTPHRVTVVPGADHFATHLMLREPSHVWYRELRAWMDGKIPAVGECAIC